MKTKTIFIVSSILLVLLLGVVYYIKAENYKELYDEFQSKLRQVPILNKEMKIYLSRISEKIYYFDMYYSWNKLKTYSKLLPIYYQGAEEFAENISLNYKDAEETYNEFESIYAEEYTKFLENKTVQDFIKNNSKYLLDFKSKRDNLKECVNDLNKYAKTLEVLTEVNISMNAEHTYIKEFARTLKDGEDSSPREFLLKAFNKHLTILEQYYNSSDELVVDIKPLLEKIIPELRKIQPVLEKNKGNGNWEEVQKYVDEYYNILKENKISLLYSDKMQEFYNNSLKKCIGILPFKEYKK